MKPKLRWMNRLMVEYLLMYEQWCRTSYTSQYLATGLHLSATNNNVCSFHLRENGLITSRVMLPSSACFHTLLISIVISTLFFRFTFSSFAIFILLLISNNPRTILSHSPHEYISPQIFFSRFLLSFSLFVEQLKKRKKKPRIFYLNNNYPRSLLRLPVIFRNFFFFFLNRRTVWKPRIENHRILIVSRATSRFVDGTLNASAICLRSF